jgi:predicted anti-sigma-YlaC factor YlaD
VSLLLDDELSQLERRMLDAHLRRCAECSAYADEVTTFTDQIRYAPMETLSRQIVVQRRRRMPAMRLQAGVAAALAFAALGLGSQLASGPTTSELTGFRPVTKYPTQAELQREIAILKYLPFRGTRSVIPR